MEPDYAVPLKPYALSEGRDPQLEKATELAAEGLKTYEKRILDPPPCRPGSTENGRRGNWDRCGIRVGADLTTSAGEHLSRCYVVS